MFIKTLPFFETSWDNFEIKFRGKKILIQKFLSNRFEEKFELNAG